MREDLIGALQSALTRKESLKSAMMSLYNAGYKKEDIEKAARELQQLSNKQPIQTTPQKKVAKEKIKDSKTKPQTKTTNLKKDNVSNYENPASKIKLILIIVILMILIGALIGFFLFKEELIEFFNNL